MIHFKWRYRTILIESFNKDDNKKNLITKKQSNN